MWPLWPDVMNIRSTVFIVSLFQSFFEHPWLRNTSEPTYWVSSVIIWEKNDVFPSFVPVNSWNYIHFYVKVCLTCEKQKIRKLHSLENSESYIYRVHEDNKKTMEGIKQELSSKSEFVSLTSVSQRLVNDCMACFATVATTSVCRELFRGVTKCDQSFAELRKSLEPYAHLTRLETNK